MIRIYNHKGEIAGAVEPFLEGNPRIEVTHGGYMTSFKIDGHELMDLYGSPFVTRGSIVVLTSVIGVYGELPVVACPHHGI